MSGKLMISTALALLFLAIVGAVMEVFGLTFGRYIVYFAVPIGAVVTMVGALLALLRKINNDIDKQV